MKVHFQIIVILEGKVMYIKRHLEDKFLQMSSFFKAVLVTGARQVGKTTMLKQLGGDRAYVSLDNGRELELAKTDPEMFLQRHKPPVIIDEVQKAPELFPYIKIACDGTDETGLFWLTGSEQFSLMRNIQESLAGRIGIMTLYPLSLSEVTGVRFPSPISFEMDALIEREKLAAPFDLPSVFQTIWRGGMPQVQNATAAEHQAYYDAYIDTYLMRDVLSVTTVRDELSFRKFVTACAAFNACQLNVASIACAADISVSTAKAWLDLLVRLHIVFLLQPYSNNKLKRLAKTPKLYFTDPGFAAHLCRWLTPEILMEGSAAGNYFENFAVIELIKDLEYSAAPYDLTYYRDSNSKEIDLFLQLGRRIHPLEIKLSANPDKREVKKFSVLDANAIERGAGGIICMSPNVMPIDKTDFLIPVNIL